MLGLSLPPGPPGKLIFGNANDMPTHYEWKTFSRWAKEYGDLVHVKVFGQHMIFVNSAEVAVDLFAKRSKIYSDRFSFPMMNDLMGFGWILAFMPYGEWWRRHRRMFHRKFHFNLVATYHAIQTRQTRCILRRLLETPDDYAKHLRHLTGAIITEVIYGFDVHPGDRYIEIAEKAAETLTGAGVPGNYLVDTIPILKYVPEWMIGAGFQKVARDARALATEMLEEPLAAVKKALSDGKAPPSITASLLEELAGQTDVPPDEEIVIRNVSAAAYIGGTETTVSSLATFVLAMRLYPEVQRKAQAELDSVIGMERLPEFADRESLPYINALCQEVLRWHPVTPLAIAHRLMEDDVYGDYFIPRGSVVVSNLWTMLQDERTFGPEPERFKPERFFDPNRKYPIFAFGFGRRACPGRHLADDSIFIVVALILKAFDILPAKDADGKDIPVEPLFTSGFMSHPEPSRCSIQPRSVSVRTLIAGQPVN